MNDDKRGELKVSICEDFQAPAAPVVCDDGVHCGECPNLTVMDADAGHAVCRITGNDLQWHDYWIAECKPAAPVEPANTPAGFRNDMACGLSAGASQPSLKVADNEWVECDRERAEQRCRRYRHGGTWGAWVGTSVYSTGEALSFEYIYRRRSAPVEDEPAESAETRLLVAVAHGRETGEGEYTEDSIEDCVSTWTKYGKGSLEVCPAIGCQWVPLEAWDSKSHILPLRITAKHADTFDPATMDRETWAKAVDVRGMIIKRVHNTTDYYATAHEWMASNYCPDCVMTAITPAQHKRETAPAESGGKCAPTADDSAVAEALRILMDDLGGRVLQSGTVCAVKIARHALDAHDKRQQAKRSGK